MAATFLNTATNSYQQLVSVVNEQFTSLAQRLDSSVRSVVTSLSLQIDEISHAYSGTCPDHSSDINPLDLDSNYVTLLDAMRRSRPHAYALLVQEAMQWHNDTPQLRDQPSRMHELCERLVPRLYEDESRDHASLSCSPLISSAASTLLSSSKDQPHHPDLPNTGS